TILRRIADCKKQLGFELTPAERKASRRWWPFGGRGGAPKMQIAKPQGSAARPKVIFALAGIAAVIAVIVGAGVGLYKMRHVNVYFDNAYAKPGFTIDGERMMNISVPLHRELRPGKHDVKAFTGET